MTATPPPLTGAAEASVSAVLDRLMSVLGDAWPQLQPWVLLLVAMELVNFAISIGQGTSDRLHDVRWAGTTAHWYSGKD